jgi:1-acyl-sn-glycerol-3-phosphate acyltransferase
MSFRSGLISIVAVCIAKAVIAFARVVTGVRGNWLGCAPNLAQRLYFANHTSHGDFILVWSAIPPRYRSVTRPVAGIDYWYRSALRRFLSDHVFKAVLIERKPKGTSQDPLKRMINAVDAGTSLILFPEGTRNTSNDALLPFKAGLYHLAKARPRLEIIPVWIENLNRVLPKGEFLPVPLLCNVTFGTPIQVRAEEQCADFLLRARTALLELSLGSTGS